MRSVRIARTIVDETWKTAFLVVLLSFVLALYLGPRNDDIAPSLIYILFTFAAFAATNIGSKLRGDPNEVVRHPSVEARTAARMLVAGLSADQKMATILEEWKHVTNVQMHFNEMIIRMRTLAVSVVITVFGAGGFTIAAHRNEFVELFGRDMHVAAFVVTFGLVLWITIFIIDYWYYYKLLLGSVRRGNEIDSAFWESQALGPLRLFGSALHISAAIGPAGFSEWPLRLFYGLVYFSGLAFLLAILVVIEPELAGSTG